MKVKKELMELVRGKLYDFRGYKVMLDTDLAEYYGITTANLNKAVKRNTTRFPEDFMFQLSNEESQLLKFQLGRSSSHGGSRHNPYVFTEKGAWTVAFILRSEAANQKGIQLIRVLEQLRDFAAKKLEELPASTRQVLENRTSVTNIYNGPVVIQQGNNNQSQVNVNDPKLVHGLIALIADKSVLDQKLIDLAKETLTLTLAKSVDKTTFIEKISKIIELGNLGYKGSELWNQVGPTLMAVIKNIT